MPCVGAQGSGWKAVHTAMGANMVVVSCWLTVHQLLGYLMHSCQRVFANSQQLLVNQPAAGLNNEWTLDPAACQGFGRHPDQWEACVMAHASTPSLVKKLSSWVGSWGLGMVAPFW